jgi:hypothetical protein
VGALAAAIVVLILIATGFAFLNLFSPTAPPQTTKPNTSSERPTVLGAGTLVLTASDYVSPNATLTRGDNITIQLFQSGTYQMKDRTGETGGQYTLFTPDSNHTAYDLYLDIPFGSYTTVTLQPNGGFLWSYKDLNATKGFTNVYAGQYVWSAPFKSA